MEAKFAYIRLNSQTTCSPIAAVPVNQGGGVISWLVAGTITPFQISIFTTKVVAIDGTFFPIVTTNAHDRHTYSGLSDGDGAHEHSGAVGRARGGGGASTSYVIGNGSNGAGTNQIVSETTGAVTTAYEYDGNGNRSRGDTDSYGYDDGDPATGTFQSRELDRWDLKRLRVMSRQINYTHG